MFNRLAIAAGVAFALMTPLQAAQQDDVAALRAEFEQKFKVLQADYEARIKALESRVQSLESKLAQAEHRGADMDVLSRRVEGILSKFEVLDL